MGVETPTDPVVVDADADLDLTMSKGQSGDEDTLQKIVERTNMFISSDPNDEKRNRFNQYARWIINKSYWRIEGGVGNDPQFNAFCALGDHQWNPFYGSDRLKHDIYGDDTNPDTGLPDNFLKADKARKIHPAIIREADRVFTRLKARVEKAKSLEDLREVLWIKKHEENKGVPPIIMNILRDGHVLHKNKYDDTIKSKWSDYIRLWYYVRVIHGCVPTSNPPVVGARGLCYLLDNLSPGPGMGPASNRGFPAMRLITNHDSRFHILKTEWEKLDQAEKDLYETARTRLSVFRIAQKKRRQFLHAQGILSESSAVWKSALIFAPFSIVSCVIMCCMGGYGYGMITGVSSLVGLAAIVGVSGLSGGRLLEPLIVSPSKIIHAWVADSSE